MNDRQKTILKLIIEHYISHAQAAGSRTLVEDYGLKVSPATVRNDMALLEDEGFLRAPHTSAGRIPTEKAYVFYFKHFVKPKRNPKARALMQKALAEKEDRSIKDIAKTMVDLSGETVVVATNQGESYYTGVSNLFSKPEFSEQALIQSISTMIDHFDEIAQGLFDQVSEEPQVMIGSHNPFGQNMSALLILSLIHI